MTEPSVILAAQDRREHAREAARLRLIAAGITTPAVKAQVFAKAQEHARLATTAWRASEDEAWAEMTRGP